MLDAFVGSVLLTLTLFGTVAICYIIMLKLLIPKSDGVYYIVLPCNQNTKNIRKKAYGTRIKFNLLGEDCWSKVIVLDYGITEKEKTDLLPICKENNGIYFVPKECLKDYFDGRI
ncbi:MAG: hypothetical protein IKW45_08950 [Clostridia bacterium]|nr:hypothetical protein [Clostridia bacterium]